MNNPYQPPGSTEATEVAPSPSPFLIVLGICLTAIPALACGFAAPQFREVFRSFGAELPSITTALIHFHGLLWLFPLAATVAVARANLASRARRSLAFGLLSVLVLLPLCFVIMYLPIIKLGGVV